jgi:hypothetical protein
MNVAGVYKRKEPEKTPFEIKKILKCPGLWPVKYSKIKEGDRASPINYPLNLEL